MGNGLSGENSYLSDYEQNIERITNEQNEQETNKQETNEQEIDERLMLLSEKLNNQDIVEYINKFLTGNPEEENICTICLLPITNSDVTNSDVTKLKCNHMFHTGCIGIWAGTIRTCPLCRESFFGRRSRRKFGQRSKRRSRRK